MIDHLQGSPSRLRELLHSPRTPHLLRVWRDVQACPSLPQMDLWLAQRFRAEKKFGQKDRRWYAEAVFSALRFGLWAVVCERMLDVESSPDLIPDVCLSWDATESWKQLRSLPPERLFHWIGLRIDSGLSSEASPYAKAEEIALLAHWFTLKSTSRRAAWLWQGLPPAFAAFEDERLKIGSWTLAQAAAFVEAQGTRPPLWIRLNRPEQLRSVEGELSAKGWLIGEGKGGALALSSDARVAGLESFQAGWIEVQDLASQQIGAAIPLSGESWVWDVCAGGGGKTMQIAARLDGKGEIFASDVRHHKLKDLEGRAQRAKFKAIHSAPWNGDQVPAFPPTLKQRGGFDAVLVDAPCTGSGTWRRNPDARFRLTPQKLREYIGIQDQVLERASRLVKGDGYLIYATCSWLAAENEERTAAFIERHPQFIRVEEKLLGCPHEDSDSMFVALLQQRSPTGAD